MSLKKRGERRDLNRLFAHRSSFHFKTLVHNPEIRALHLFLWNSYQIFYKESSDRVVYLEKETPDLQNLNLPLLKQMNFGFVCF